MAVEYLPTMNNRVWIFDTTLRDGEQSPGCSMTVPEKGCAWRESFLVELGVTSSKPVFRSLPMGDFEAVGRGKVLRPMAQAAAFRPP